MDVKTAIEAGDAIALRRVLAEDPSQANGLITWGPNCRSETHPLHYVSDMVFAGRLDGGRELLLIEVLLKAGSEVDFQKPAGAGDKKPGETALIGAASLGAEEVGLWLLDAGARPEIHGKFGETALHWGAIMGLDRLVRALIDRGAALDDIDERYGSPPLGWAIHGWTDPLPGSRHGRHHEVVRLLVAAGAVVKPEWLADETVRADAEMLAALSGGRAGVGMHSANGTSEMTD